MKCVLMEADAYRDKLAKPACGFLDDKFFTS